MISFLSQWILILLSILSPGGSAVPVDAAGPGLGTEDAGAPVDPAWPILPPPPPPPEGPRRPKQPPVRPEEVATTWSDIKTRFRGPRP